MNSSVIIDDLSVVLGGDFKALRDINLELPAGKIVGFIGPSGAGKTTLIRAIIGRQKIASGNINVFGQPAGTAELRKVVSYMTQELSVYPDLSVRENLLYFARMAGLKKGPARAAVRETLRTVELDGKAGNLVSNLSGGQARRVSLAVALLARPKLLVLDEPTVGLDPVLREKLWALFHWLAADGTSLIISSHVMDEASRCDDLVLIRDGRIIVHDSPAEFIKSAGVKTVEDGFLKLAGGKK